MQKVIILLMAGLLALLLLGKIDLTTADLGRHLKNGETFVSSGKIVTTNFYSYTNPDFPVVNHHWGAGVIFFLLYKLGGFNLLSFAYVLGLVLAAGLFWQVAQKKSGWTATLVTFIFLLPLISHRAEVRPEVFSYLFCGIFVYLLYHRRGLFLLPILEILWVNTHIYFFLGPVLVAIFLFRKPEFWRYFLSTGVAAIINPFGLAGAVYPLSIWRDFAYRLVENQSVFFLEGINFVLPNFLVFKLAILTLAAGLIAPFEPLILLAFVGGTLGLLAIRNFTLMGLFLLPGLAFLTKKINAPFWVKVGTVGLIVLLTLSVEGKTLKNRVMGAGILPGNLKALEFFQKNNLAGPIFNNYDIGGYLIYGLYPKEKVFVDNRPEAYPGEFFREVYVPMQESEEKWRKIDGKYHFQTIFFSHRDYTPWGQQFLAVRIKDPQWKVVYLDNFAVIFVRQSK